MPNLWNVQTQKPEWVQPENTAAALASGSYTEYGGSSVALEAGGGLTTSRPAVEGAEALVSGSRAVSAGQLRADQLAEEERAAQDNLAAEALTMFEGGVAGMSAGLIDPANLSRDAAVRREVNPVAGGLGRAGGALGGALLGAGPAGWITRGAGKVAANVAARAASPAAQLAIREAVAGGLEGAGFSAGAQVGGALWADRPFSAEAFATDVGLGAFLGGALAGTKLAAARGAREPTRSAAVEAADDLLRRDSPMSRGISDDFRSVGGAWDGALGDARARVEALSAAAARGEVPGVIRGPLHVREKLVGEAQAARDGLHRALRVGKDGDPWERLAEVLDSGTPKRVQAVARALDGYGAAVQRLDDAMRPQLAEMALAQNPIRLGAAEDLVPPPGAPVRAQPTVRLAGGPTTAPTRLGDPNVAPPGGAGSGFATETFAPSPGTVVENVTPVPGSVGGTGVTGPMGAPAAPGWRRGPAVRNVVPGQAVRDFAAAPVRPPVGGPSAMADLLSARLGKMDAVLIPRGASLDYAEAAGLRADGLGPLGERAVQLWSLRRFARKLGSARPERSAGGRLLEEGAALAAGIATPGGPGLKWGARQVARAAIRSAVGIGESVGRVKLALAKGLDGALTEGVRTAARRAVVAVDYSGGDRPTRDFARKATALRELVGNPEALRAKVAAGPATGDLRGIDPDLAGMATEAAAMRLESLANALPPLPASEAYAAVEPGTAPADTTARQIWENRERVSADPAGVTMSFVRSGAVPPEIGETLRETNPQLVNKLAEQVLDAGPEVLSAAPHATLVGLSQVLGMPLVPEADIAYRARAQERYRVRRQANQEIQGRQQGAAAIRGGNMIAPTPGQVMASPPPPVNLSR